MGVKELSLLVLVFLTIGYAELVSHSSSVFNAPVSSPLNGQLLTRTSITQQIKGNLEQMNRNTMLTIGNIFQSASPCKCTEKSCSCEFIFFIDNPFQSHQGLICVEYDVTEGLTVSLKAGGAVKQETINVQQGENLPALCVPLPQFPVLQFCVVFYDVQLNQNTGVHVCLNLEAQATLAGSTTTLATISFDCISVGPMQISLVSPDVTRPSFVGVHLGKTPKITFFNLVSIGVIPTIEEPPFLEKAPFNLNFNQKPLKLIN